MKVGIIQLSDIHFKAGTNLVLDCQDKFVDACLAHLEECTKIIVAVSGDIAFSGSSKEYNIAYAFFKGTEKVIKERAKWINSYDYVFVPGNHDCNFFPNDDVRDLIIQTVSKGDVLDKDGYIDGCLKPQKEFWEFFKKMTGKQELSFISYKVTIPLFVDTNIEFNCYNTSLLSRLEEIPGSLIVPKNHLIRKSPNKKDLSISIFHHNPSWLSSSTPENNKKIFENHLIQNADIVLCGHEHQETNLQLSSIINDAGLIYLESGTFQSEGTSSFNLLVVESIGDEFGIKDYGFQLNTVKNFYDCVKEEIIKIPEKIQGIEVTSDFIKKLEAVDMPIHHPNKLDLKLQDIFVYPDLEPLEDIDTTVVQFIDAEEILDDKEQGQTYFIEGESQIGKTSLMKMYFLKAYSNRIFPLLLSAKDVNYPNIRELLKKKYKEEYCYKDFSFEQYMQLSLEKRILLIDDFEETSLNDEGKKELFEFTSKLFCKTIITSSLQNDIYSFIITEGNNASTKKYILKSLGYYKRNLLIEKWIRLGRDRYTLDNAQLEREVQKMFDQVSNLLGDQFVPSYPVFILSLLQGLNGGLKDFNVSQTSYGFCYYSLIIAALQKEKIPHINIEGIISFLSYLSYDMYSKHRDTFTYEEFTGFYVQFSKKYIASYSLDKLLHILLQSYILKSEDKRYKFTYKYLFYYLIAFAISKLEIEDDKSKIVKDLCNNLYKEKEANILIFLVNQGNINGIIEELIFSSWLPYEDYIPVTLDIDDHLFQQLNGIVKDIKTTVMRQDVNPHETRIKELKEHDQTQLSKSSSNKIVTEEELEQNKELQDLAVSLKITKIIGQITKNQKNTFSKDKLLTLVTEAYNVTFRSIAFFSKMIDDSKKEIAEHISETNSSRSLGKDEELTRKVSKFLQSLIFRFCLTNFSNLSLSVGTSDLDVIFDEVAAYIGSPAAKIVSFSIKTYYNKLNIKDLENIVAEFKNNPVAFEIIRSRVISYVYHNYIDLKLRQHIGQICHIKLVNEAGYNQYIKERIDQIKGRRD